MQRKIQLPQLMISRNRYRPSAQMKQILLSFILLAVMGPGFTGPGHAATAEDLTAALTRHLNCFPLQLVDLNNQEISITNEELCLAAIYTATGMKPLWVSADGPEQRAAVILYYLTNAEAEGLPPDNYNVDTIQSLWLSNDPDHLARLDTQLTLNFVKYAHDVSHGRITPYKTDPLLFAEAGDIHFMPARIIQQALNAPDLAVFIAGLPPSHEYYTRLRDALKHYRELAARETWEPIPRGKSLHPGDRDERILLVRKRLVQAGALNQTGEDDPLYDDRLAAAIKQFQHKNHLEDDGIIGKNTLAALNTGPDEIVKKIILNMARWRWQEHELGTRYVMVNIANYDLKAVHDNQVQLEMAVIVGELQNQTPVFSHRIQYLDFNPFWNIPPSIARNEELRALRADPYYLVNRHVRLFSSWDDDAVELDSTLIDWQAITPRQMNRYKLRQDPGPWNALGRIKFVFPNRYDVYLHDTPGQDLFTRKKRSFSHGCIRVSRPLALAQFVLAEEPQDWSEEKIGEVVASSKRKVVTLTKPLPVHITYQTVWVDNQGIIHFNNDNYGRDAMLAEILFPPTPAVADSAK
jgi:murein L,D-transpeptidase YcbB/YkuD